MSPYLLQKKGGQRMNNYIIIYDHTQLQFDLNDIHKYITQSPEVKDWWHYLPNVYIITTNMTVDRMTKTMSETYPGLRFLISKINFNDYNGVLKTGAWEWIKKKTKETLNLKPVPSLPPITLMDIQSRLNKPATERVEKTQADTLLKLISDRAKKEKK